ncbi:MAG: hypothetical protein RX316_00155 [bacterium]|nr:hypothetical protein [bacterium]
MLRRSWCRGILLVIVLAGLLAGCRSAPPPPTTPAQVPTGLLCQVQGPPDIKETAGSGWTFCVRQKADCNLSNVAGAISQRWCAQSRQRTCGDTGCQKYRSKACRFAVNQPPGVELRATQPPNADCGRRWACTVATPPAGRYACRCDCPACDGPAGAKASRAPLVQLAAGAYAVVVVWPDNLCPNGQMRVSALEGEAFTLTAVGKCLPKELKLRAVFAPAGGAFFAVGEDPAGHGDYHLIGVVEDPDAFSGILTRTIGTEERVAERIRLTGRLMIATN